MKKNSFKSLKLNKKTISNIKGGQPAYKPTYDVACTIHFTQTSVLCPSSFCTTYTSPSDVPSN